MGWGGIRPCLLSSVRGNNVLNFRTSCAAGSGSGFLKTLVTKGSSEIGRVTEANSPTESQNFILSLSKEILKGICSGQTVMIWSEVCLSVEQGACSVYSILHKVTLDLT